MSEQEISIPPIIRSVAKFEARLSEDQTSTKFILSRIISTEEENTLSRLVTQYDKADYLNMERWPTSLIGTYLQAGDTSVLRYLRRAGSKRGSKNIILPTEGTVIVSISEEISNEDLRNLRNMDSSKAYQELNVRKWPFSLIAYVIGKGNEESVDRNIRVVRSRSRRTVKEQKPTTTSTNEIERILQLEEVFQQLESIPTKRQIIDLMKSKFPTYSVDILTDDLIKFIFEFYNYDDIDELD